MLPQWHRGTPGAWTPRERFHDEVAGASRRRRAGRAERVRLMWIGRGLWFNLGFYEYFEERYGAVFVWSI